MSATLFNAEQAAAWREHWDRTLRHGDQKRIAEALADIDKSVETWRPELSRFFKADPQALPRVLADARACGVIDAQLGAAAGAGVRAVHARIVGTPADAADDVRIPAFEEHGAFRAERVYVPGVSDVSGARVDGLQPLTLDALADACRQLAASPLPEVAVVQVEGRSGTGKTLLLRALGARFRAEGPSTAVVVRDGDDAGSLAGAASPARVRVEVRASALPAATPVALRVRLRGADRGWAHAYVDRVQALLTERGAGLSAERLRVVHDWLDDDPLALARCDHPSALGMVLRAAQQGVPLDVPSARPGVLARLLAARLPHGSVRAFLEDHGERILAAFAGCYVRSGGAPVARAELVDALVSCTDGGRLLSQHGAYEMLGAVLAGAPFRVVPGGEGAARIACDALAFLLPAARIDRPSTGSMRVLTEPTLVAAAEALMARSGDALLADIEALPSHARVASMRNVAELLRTPRADFLDAARFTRVFRACASFWGHRVDPGVEAPDEHVAHGASPLVLLAEASRRHAALLPRPFPPIDPARDLPGALGPWLALHGFGPLDGAVLAAFVAPAHASEWPAIPRLLGVEGEAGGSMSVEEMQQLLHHVLLPAWAESGEWTACLAGTREGTSAEAGLFGRTEADVERWADALDQRLRDKDPRAPGALAQALALAFARGGGVQHRVLAARLPRWVRHRAALRGPVRQALCAHTWPRAEWEDVAFGDPGLLRVVAQQLLDPEDIAEVWDAWRRTDAPDLPWRSLRAAGLPPARVLPWALSRGREDAVAELIEGDAEAVEACGLPGDLSPQYPVLLPRLHRMAPDDRVAERIAAARRTSDRVLRSALLASIWPAEEHAEAWGLVVAGEPDRVSRLGRIAQGCAGQTRVGRWDPLIAELDAAAGWPRPYAVQMLSAVDRLVRTVLGAAPAVADDRGPLLAHMLASPVVGPAVRHRTLDACWPLVDPAAIRSLVEDAPESLLGEDSRPERLASLARSGALGVVQSFVHDPALGSSVVDALSAASLDGALDPDWALRTLRTRVPYGPPVPDGVSEGLAALALRCRPAEAWAWMEERCATGGHAWWAAVMRRLPPSVERARCLEAWFAAVDAAAADE